MYMCISSLPLHFMFIVVLRGTIGSLHEVSYDKYIINRCLFRILMGFSVIYSRKRIIAQNEICLAIYSFD